MTIADVVARYIAIHGKRPRGEKTLEEYQRIADLYIVPHLGSIPVANLRPAKVNEWKNALIDSGGQNGRAISGKTARHAFTLLNAALRRAVREELAGRNVCESADAPEVRRKELKAFDESEISRLIVAARGTRWENFIALALGSGARRGEVLALSWNGINLEARTMRIDGSMSQICEARLPQRYEDRSRARRAALTGDGRRVEGAAGATGRRSPRTWSGVFG